MEKIQTSTDYGSRSNNELNNDKDIIIADNVVSTMTILMATNMTKTTEAKGISCWIKAIWTGRTTSKPTDARSFSHLKKVMIVTIVSVSGTT